MTALHLLFVLTGLNWLLLLGLALSVVRLQDMITEQRRRRDATTFKRDVDLGVGTMAPPLEGKTLQGASADPSSPPSPQVVWFMSDNCGSCERSSPMVQMIAREFSGKIGTIVSVAGKGRVMAQRVASVVSQK